MKISVVTWIDARVSVDGSHPKLPVMKSIGIIIEKTKEKISICSLMGDDGDPRIITSIPMGIVNKIEHLRRKK